jgi:hypothetical protein
VIYAIPSNFANNCRKRKRKRANSFGNFTGVLRGRKATTLLASKGI